MVSHADPRRRGDKRAVVRTPAGSEITLASRRLRRARESRGRGGAGGGVFGPVVNLVAQAGTAELAGLPRLGDDTIAADAPGRCLPQRCPSRIRRQPRAPRSRSRPLADRLRVPRDRASFGIRLARPPRIGVGVLVDVRGRGRQRPDAEIGDFAIVNTAAVVEHDCIVGEGAHVAPGAVLGGGVRVGARTLMGIGSVMRPNIHESRRFDGGSRSRRRVGYCERRGGDRRSGGGGGTMKGLETRESSQPRPACGTARGHREGQPPNRHSQSMPTGASSA